MVRQYSGSGAGFLNPSGFDAGIGSPAELGALWGWWESSGIVPQTAGTNNHTDWTDSSGNGNDLDGTQATSSRQSGVVAAGGFFAQHCAGAGAQSRGINTLALQAVATGSVVVYGRITSLQAAIAAFAALESDFSSRYMNLGVDASENIYASIDRPQNQVGILETWTSSVSLTVDQLYCMVFAQDGVAMTAFVDGIEVDLTWSNGGGVGNTDGDWFADIGAGVHASQGPTVFALGARTEADAGPVLGQPRDGLITGEQLEACVYNGTVLNAVGASQLTDYFRAKYPGA